MSKIKTDANPDDRLKRLGPQSGNYHDPCVCVHSCVCVFMCVYLFVCVFVCIHVSVFICVCVFMCVFAFVCVCCMCVCVYSCVCIYVCVFMCVFLCVCVCVYVCVVVCVCFCVCVWFNLKTILFTVCAVRLVLGRSKKKSKLKKKSLFKKKIKVRKIFYFEKGPDTSVFASEPHLGVLKFRCIAAGESHAPNPLLARDKRILNIFNLLR